MINIYDFPPHLESCIILPFSKQPPNYLPFVSFVCLFFFVLFICFYQGERLDQHSCEALEVVLKSLHFDFINLQAAQLEENVSFMIKMHFCHLRLPIPIQFHAQALFCIRLEVHYFPSERTS